MAAVSNIITVSGDIRTVQSTLRRLSETIKNREALGFDSLAHEAEWMYITERDDRVCFFCRKFEHTIHRGDYIPRRFPDYSFIDDRHIAPQIHVTYPFLKGVCRCVLEAVNVGEFTEKQLHEEKLTVL